MAPNAIRTTGELSGESDVCLPKAVYLTVYDTLGRNGFDVSRETVEGYEAPEHSTLRTGAGLLPTWVTGELSNQMREKGLAPMDLGKTFAGTFKEDNSGASGSTTAFVVDEMSLAGAVETLIESGQVEVIRERANLYTDYPNLDEVAAFEIAEKAKGWMAERIVTNVCEKYRKGTITHDDAGIDVWAGEWDADNARQVRSVTWYASQSTDKLAAHDVTYLWYQWDCDGHLVVGKVANDVNAKAADATGVGKTLIKRSAGNLKAVRESGYDNVRYLWW